MARRLDRRLAICLLALLAAACSDGGPPSPYALDVLYYVDGTNAVDGVSAALAAIRAERPELGLTVVDTPTELLAELAGGPGFVVVFNQGAAMRATVAAALVDWVAGGGRLVAFDWFWRPDLLDALEVELAATNLTSLTLTDARLDVGLDGPLAVADTGWTTTFSTGFATASGVVAATFEDGSAGIVFGNGGRTAAVGFTNDALGADVGPALFRRLLDLMLLRKAGPLP